MRVFAGAAALLVLLQSGCRGDVEPVVLGAAAAGGFLNGVRMAVEMADPRGLPALDTVLIREGANRSVPALQAAERLISTPGLVAVIGHSNSTASLATSQIYNRAGVVQIAVTSTAPVYSEAGPFSFRMVPPDHAQAVRLARLLEESLPPVGRVALFYVNDDYGRSLRRLLLDQLVDMPLQVVLDLPHAEGDIQTLDRDHHLSALESGTPDAILWLGRVPVLNALLPGIRERMGDIPIYGGDGLSPANLDDDFGALWNGVHYLDFVDMDATAELQEFQMRFRERFGTRAGGREVLSFDATGALLEALRQGARTGDDVRAFLLELGRTRPPYPGVSGPVTFLENGDAHRDYVLKVIRRCQPGVSP